MNGVVVFIGPTLDPDAIPPGLHVRGPARRGDVLLAMRAGFRDIAIVDGYFDHALPVWHKEILYALSQGHRVWGAASMGALRAAELARYGMRGIGRIFEAYRDGLLEDDDEVVIVHGDAEAKYRAMSEALVNMRVTLSQAVTDGVLGSTLASEYLSLARACYYPERNYAQLLSLAANSATLAPTVPALRAWLGPRFENKRDQKARDAAELLAQLGSTASDEPKDPQHVGERFVFAHTDGFQQLVDQLGLTL